MPVEVDRTPCPAARDGASCYLDLGHHGPHRAGRPSGVDHWEEVLPDGERCTSSRTVTLPNRPSHVQRCRGRRGHGGEHWTTEPHRSFIYRWTSTGARTFRGGEPLDLVPGDFAQGYLLQYRGKEAPHRIRLYRLGFNVGSGRWKLRDVKTSDDFDSYVERTYSREEDRDAAFDGFYDAVEGREDGHSKFCRHHFDGKGGCGVA